MVAFVPQERQQTITSPVKGIAVRIVEGLVEGAQVKEGDFLVEIEPTAANLKAQLQASVKDLDTKLATANAKAEVYGQNIRDWEAAKIAAVAAADELIAAAKAKWDAKERLVPAYQAKALQAELNYERQRGLFEKGVRAEMEMEKYRKDLDVAGLSWSLSCWMFRKHANSGKPRVASEHRRSVKRRPRSTTPGPCSRTPWGKPPPSRKRDARVEVKLSELDRLVIHAPRDGTLFRLNVFERGQMLKEGDELFTIVPDTTTTSGGAVGIGQRHSAGPPGRPRAAAI